MKSSPQHDPYAAFRIREYRLYIFGSIIAQLGTGLQSMAIGWEMYQRTRKALALGMVGPVFSVVSGGFGTIGVVLLTALSSPTLCAFGALHEAKPIVDEANESEGGLGVSGTTVPDRGATHRQG